MCVCYARKTGETMQVLAIESSTSSAKAVLYDTEKGIVAGKQKAYGPDIDHLGMTDPVEKVNVSSEITGTVVFFISMLISGALTPASS